MKMWSARGAIGVVFLFFIAGFAPSPSALDAAFLRRADILRLQIFRPDGAVGPPPRPRWGPLAVKSGPARPAMARGVEGSLDIDLAGAISAENLGFPLCPRA